MLIVTFPLATPIAPLHHSSLVEMEAIAHQKVAISDAASILLENRQNVLCPH